MSNPTIALLGKAAVCCVCAAVACGVICQPAQAQGRHIPPHPEGWVERWWSWAHWWEANQLSMINPPEYVAPQPALQEQAVAVLMEVIKSDNAELAAEAAIALGKIGVVEAVPRLVELTDHGNEELRRTAWMGLGLIDDAAAYEHFLAGNRPQSFSNEADLCAWIIGVGLMAKPPDKVFTLLHQVLTGSNSQEAQSLAAWAIRVHNPPGTVDLMDAVLHESDDAQLVSEAILALGQNRSERHEQLISYIYLDIGLGREIPSLTRLHDAYRAPGVLNPRHGPAIVGIRTAAAIALGNYDSADEDDRSIARRNLRRPFNELTPEQRAAMPADLGRYVFYDKGWSLGYSRHLGLMGHAEVRSGLVSLGRVGIGEGGEDILSNIMEMRYTDRVPGQAKPRDPNRAMAAIGLGLDAQRTVMRAADDLAHRRDRAVRDQRRRLQRLERYLTDRSEPVEFRAACALAMGLSKQDLAKEMLLNALNHVQANESLLAGHIMLALGMLGETAMLRHAEAWGWELVEEVDVQRLRQQEMGDGSDRVAALARRAAVMGVGLLGEKEAGSRLVGEFGDDYFVSQSVVRSLKWSGHYDITETLVQLLENPEGSDLDLLAVWALGELYEPRSISRLNRLMQDVNFTLPNYQSFPRLGHQAGFGQRIGESEVYRFRAYAAPFMHRRLLYGSGINWR